MMEFKSPVDKETHTTIASTLFNAVWDLMERSDRSPADDELMVNAAHASRFNWGMVGTPLHFARGEWQISRVYTVVRRVEPALHHAENSMSLCLNHQLGDFDLGFAYEACARAWALQGDRMRRDRYLGLARQCADRVESTEDRTWLMDNINTVMSLLPRGGD